VSMRGVALVRPAGELALRAGARIRTLLVDARTRFSGLGPAGLIRIRGGESVEVTARSCAGPGAAVLVARRVVSR
jgi:hypothetical protein